MSLAEDECGIVLRGDPEMEAIATRIYNLRKSRLIHTFFGEPGVGKEGLAAFVNAVSPRGGDFHVVNIAGLSDSLIESELFGHEKGSFSGAGQKRMGRFELIQKTGTLLLDEVGELTPVKQATVLRATSDNPKITPVGANQEIDIHGRITCATNADLSVLEKAGRFRRDLRERLEACMISVPIFRNRAEAHRVTVITKLAKRFRKESGCNIELSESAIDLLLNEPPTGNVRGIKNLLERTTYMAIGANKGVLDADLLRSEMTDSFRFSLKDIKENHPQDVIRIDLPLTDEERQGLSPVNFVRNSMAQQALERTNGNQSKASLLLRVTRQAFRSWLKPTFGIDKNGASDIASVSDNNS